MRAKYAIIGLALAMACYLFYLMQHLHDPGTTETRLQGLLRAQAAEIVRLKQLLRKSQQQQRSKAAAVPLDAVPQTPPESLSRGESGVCGPAVPGATVSSTIGLSPDWLMQEMQSPVGSLHNYHAHEGAAPCQKRSFHAIYWLVTRHGTRAVVARSAQLSSAGTHTSACI